MGWEQARISEYADVSQVGRFEADAEGLRRMSPGMMRCEEERKNEEFLARLLACLVMRTELYRWVDIPLGRTCMV